MGKKSTPAPPPAPDYGALAQQQADLNKQAAAEQTQANRADQYNPYGSLTWSQDPVTGHWTQIEQLSQAGQDIFDAQQAAQLGLANTGLGLLGSAQDAVKDPFSLEGLPGLSGVLPPASTTSASYRLRARPLASTTSASCPRWVVSTTLAPWGLCLRPVLGRSRRSKTP
jgi:hypothetical protein